MKNASDVKKTEEQVFVKQNNALLDQLGKTKLARSVRSIRPLILAALIGGSPLLNSCSKDDFVEETQNQIEELLQQNGRYYDQKTKATYVFDDTYNMGEKSATSTRLLAPKQ